MLPNYINRDVFQIFSSNGTGDFIDHAWKNQKCFLAIVVSTVLIAKHGHVMQHLRYADDIRFIRTQYLNKFVFVLDNGAIKLICFV